MLRKVEIHYFKWTGKFYTEAEAEIEDNTEPKTKSGMPSVANMYAISNHIEYLQRMGQLPGLTPGSKWENGLIWFNCDDGYPCIKVPKVAKDAMEQATNKETEKS